MKKIEDYTYKEYIYKSDEEKKKHKETMESEGWEDSGQVKLNINYSIYNPDYRWYGKYFKRNHSSDMRHLESVKWVESVAGHLGDSIRTGIVADVYNVYVYIAGLENHEDHMIHGVSGEGKTYGDACANYIECLKACRGLEHRGRLVVIDPDGAFAIRR